MKSEKGEISEDKPIASGPIADVWLFGEALDEYKALLSRTDQQSVKSATQLPAYFKRFVDIGAHALSEQMFKQQSRQKTGVGGEVLVHEFKSYQFRIYGVVCTFKGKRSFMGTACDPYKKKDKADPKKLKKAAEQWARITK